MTEEAFRWIVTGGVAIAALCILIMAVVAIMMFKAVSKLRASVTPVIETVGQIARENAPKVSAIATRVEEIAANAKDMSDVAKDQAHRFAEVGRDLADRTKAQVARVDSVVDETVENVQHAGDNMKAAVMKPMREAGAVFAGLRAAVFSLAGHHSDNNTAQDEEMFI